MSIMSKTSSANYEAPYTKTFNALIPIGWTISPEKMYFVKQKV